VLRNKAKNSEKSLKERNQTKVSAGLLDREYLTLYVLRTRNHHATMDNLVTIGLERGYHAENSAM
jgi:hypothetical protein